MSLNKISNLAYLAEKTLARSALRIYPISIKECRWRFYLLTQTLITLFPLTEVIY